MIKIQESQLEKRIADYNSEHGYDKITQAERYRLISQNKLCVEQYRKEHGENFSKFFDARKGW